MKTRKPAQKLSLVIAYFCYTAAFIALLIAGYQSTHTSTANPLFASLVASVVFLLGCGIVLHVIGTVSLPDLKIGKTHNK